MAIIEQSYYTPLDLKNRSIPISEEIYFRWLGVAGIELRWADRVLMLDPFFTRPPIRYVFGGRVQPDRALVGKWVKSCDYLLITHAHYDHLMDVPEVIRLTGVKAYGSPNTCDLLRMQGVPPEFVGEIKGGELIEFDGFKVKALPAEHLHLPVFKPGRLADDLRPPLRLRDYRMDEPYSYYLELGGMRLLAWCGVDGECERAAEVLFLGPLGGGGDYQRLIASVRPRVIVLIHWDDFFRPLSKPVRPSLTPPRWSLPPWRRFDPYAYCSQLEARFPGMRVLVPEVFQPYPLNEIVAFNTPT